MSPVIADKMQELERAAREAWPRPGEVPCECGGRAFQCGPSSSYHCLRCGVSRTAWTGFDDPNWF